ncbi:hypothetical protein ACSMFR_02890 [Listeria aquatica]|uniref:Uncharacterized protein n=2 Tax=Listeria aquatica TaxID=1494960 RepID=W7B1D3_9LIST|nr:hypothetical protein [Listeria aquatica]EUJ21054.1 hypothetical protein MAQA_03721 [Listeria aquatica FSL S10-1188]MBC1521455.1 hypothetical protein [Listeria aquatica]
MRFIFAYLTVFILGIFSCIGVEAILFGKLNAELIFAAILIAAPLILVGATIAEIYYGFSKNATWLRFAFFGFLYGLFAVIIITGVMQVASMLVVTLISILSGIIAAILALIFFTFRGGKKSSGKAVKSND